MDDDLFPESWTLADLERCNPRSLSLLALTSSRCAWSRGGLADSADALLLEGLFGDMDRPGLVGDMDRPGLFGDMDRPGCLRAELSRRSFSFPSLLSGPGLFWHSVVVVLSFEGRFAERVGDFPDRLGR